MKVSMYLLAVCAMVSLSTEAADKDQVGIKAKNLANSLCVTCHGTNGISVVENFPNLAGQKETYLAKQLKDFRDGNRKDPVMWNMAASLDDDLIRALAKHYAAQELP